MKNTVSKAWEVPDAERNAFEYLDLIVAAFRETIRIRTVKGVQYVPVPVVNRGEGTAEFRDIRTFGH